MHNALDEKFHRIRRLLWRARLDASSLTVLGELMSKSDAQLSAALDEAQSALDDTQAAAHAIIDKLEAELAAGAGGGTDLTPAELAAQLTRIKAIVADARGTFPAVTAPPATIELAPASADVKVGASLQLVPTVKDTTGAVIDKSPVTYTSSDETVATVDATGLVTGVAVGGVSISGSAGDPANPDSPIAASSITVVT
jgi:hypothetical protein